MTGIYDYCEGLAEFPFRGAARDDLRPGLRIIGYRRQAAIAYAVTDTTVQIVAIYHGGRNYESILGTGDDSGQPTVSE